MKSVMRIIITGNKPRSYSDDYQKAAKKEINNLEGMGAYADVDCEDNISFIIVTCTFKCKQFPNGREKKYEVHFHVCREQQYKGIDFMETYTPVVLFGWWLFLKIY